MNRTPSILVVDDEPRMCESIKYLLEMENFEVQTVYTGTGALKFMENKHFDLFLMDMRLPEMDGFELMAKTFRREPDAPVIVITGNASIDSATKALKMGAYDYLRKPFEPEDLIKNVKNALEQKRLKDENKAITERLRQSEKRYRTLVHNSPDMIYTLDAAGNFVFVNEAVERLLGYDSGELVGRPYKTIMNNGNDISTEDLFNERRTGELVRKDGTRCFVETSLAVVKDQNGLPSGCRGIDRDISDRKRLEEDLLDSYRRLQDARVTTILGLARLAEYRDQDTGEHLERIREYARIICEAMSRQPKYSDYITEEYIEDIYHSSILHDIGKVGIPDSILLKPGKLTKKEFEIIKRHSVIGGDALAAVEAQIQGQSFLTLGKEIAYHHHEKWDGTGYPFGLQAEKIPLSARQVALADVYDALTSERTYKEAFSHEKSREIIISERGRQFDPDVVDAFLSREDDFRSISRMRGADQAPDINITAVSAATGMFSLSDKLPSRKAARQCIQLFPRSLAYT